MVTIGTNVPERKEVLREEAVTLRSGALAIDGRLAVPAGATRAAVVCHPHPQYGGAMDNPVVVAVTDHLARAGIAALRFDFRGVGRSEGAYGGGVGEAEDARAAVAFVRERTGLGSVTLAGYSFGALVALLAGHDDPGVDRLAAIALPATMFDTGFLAACTKPRLFLLGDRDQYCPYPALERVVAALPEPKTLRCLHGADHFLSGYEDEIANQVARFAAA
jgi:hypothetical protein